MSYIYQEDSVELAPERISTTLDPIHGPVTVFHDVIIASEMVQPYPDGRALKSRDELEAYTWTVDGRWVKAGGHPEDAIISDRGDVSGRTMNPHFVKNLKDPKTGRPCRAGVRADIHIFDKKVSPELLDGMRKGKKSDVSIGFFFKKDETPGKIADGPFVGEDYDYVQRNMFHDHLAVGLDTKNGRCPSPYCGLGADEIVKSLTGDPFAGFCYTDDTEILTKKGIKKINDVSIGDIVASINLETEEFEWNEVKNKFIYEYDGDVIHFDGKKYNLMVTPNHRMIAKEMRQEKFEFIEAKDLIKTFIENREFIGNCKWGGIDKEIFEIPSQFIPWYEKEKIYNEAIALHAEGLGATKISEQTGSSRSQIQSWIRYRRKPWGRCNANTKFDMNYWVDYYGWYLSEGCTSTNNSKKNTKTVISQKIGSHEEELDNCHRNLGIGFSKIQEKDGMNAWYVFSHPLSQYLSKHGKSHDKFIEEDIKNLPKERLMILLSSLMMGDGCRNRTYYTASKQLRDDVMEIALKCGYSVSYNSKDYRLKDGGNGKCYDVGISRTQTTPRIRTKPKIIHYEGKVVGLTVDNGTLFVGRKGRFIWSGNSNFAECQIKIKEKNPDLSDESVVKICGSLKAKHEDILDLEKMEAASAIARAVLCECEKEEGKLKESGELDKLKELVHEGYFAEYAAQSTKKQIDEKIKEILDQL